jgi:hypothetical protein
MSSLIIDFPDCADLGSHDPGRANGDAPQDTITVFTENCPAAVINNPQPLISSWMLLLSLAVVLATVVATSIVRYKSHEMKPRRLEQQRLAEKNRLDAQVAMAKVRKNCPTCGDVYEPKLKEDQ